MTRSLGEVTAATTVDQSALHDCLVRALVDGQHAQQELDIAIRMVRSIEAQVEYLQTEREAIRQLCRKAGMAEISTTLDYLRGVFHLLTQKQRIAKLIDR